MDEYVILVDKSDAEVGVAEKLAAHRAGALHRAVSVFVFSPGGELILQKRAKTKYHSGGLWSNTCCSHPRPNESAEAAAHRRLKEEMGFDCPLTEVYSFTYQASFGNGLIEREYDHVFVGVFNGEPAPNPEEADDWKRAMSDVISADMREHPEDYSYWFRVSFDEVLSRARREGVIE